MQQQEKMVGIVSDAAQKSVQAEAEEPKCESVVAVVAAILANIAVGIVKFIASAISGSSSEQKTSH